MVKGEANRENVMSLILLLIKLTFAHKKKVNSQKLYSSNVTPLGLVDP